MKILKLVRCQRYVIAVVSSDNCFSETYNTGPVYFFPDHFHLFGTNPSDVFYISVSAPLPFSLCLSISSSRFLHFSGGGGWSTAALHHRCEGGRFSLRQRFVALHLHQMNSCHLFCLVPDTGRGQMRTRISSVFFLMISKLHFSPIKDIRTVYLQMHLHICC